MRHSPSYLAVLVCLSTFLASSQAHAVDNAATFLKPYTNPEQQKLPAEGIYPAGQRMLFSGYSSGHSQQMRMIQAGFPLDGPHYHGRGQWMLPNWEAAEAAGMKNFFRLRISDYERSKHWGAVLPRMKTAEGRAEIKRQVISLINYVQIDPDLNGNIIAWYAYPEEPIKRGNTAMSEQWAYMKFVHDIIKATDRRKRPLYVSERSDSSLENMMANQRYQDGVLKQNYLVRGNGYGGDDEMRVLMWQWARDQVVCAEKSDALYPSYTGYKRAAITTLSMYIDPKDEARRNETWLRRIITHDIYVQLAAGIDGFMLYTWPSSDRYSQTTKKLQENLYMEVLGQIVKEGLGKVFLWGDDRDDVQLDIVEGPKTVQWKKFSATYKAPSIRMRNIQYGGNRYILLVNSAKEVVRPRLSGFPAGMKLLDMIPYTWSDLNRNLSPTLQPLGVRMYKIGSVD